MTVAPLNLSVASAAEEDLINSDKYTEIQERFYNLGLLHDEVDYSEENTGVRRDSFIMAALRLANSDEVSATTEDVFTDVVKDDPTAPYIKRGVELGYLSGYSDGTFCPENIIKTEQAVKVLVRMLGYGDKAEAAGGYPNGYIAVADSLGLTDNVKFVSGSNLTYGTMLKLFDNALDIDIPQLIISGTPEITTESEVTLLEARHKIYYTKGIVTGNSVTALKNHKETAEGIVSVEGVQYYNGDTTIADMLGNKVDIYYNLEKGEDLGTILHYSEDKDNYTYTIDDDDLYKNNTAFKYTYFDAKDREKTINITDDINVIFNGKLKVLYGAADLNPSYGQVTLIDNDGDNEYEIISIFSVTDTVVVKSTMKTDANTVITDAVDMSKSYSLSNSGDVDYRVIMNGQNVDPADLSKGTVLSIGETDGYILMYAGKDSVSGTVESLLDGGEIARIDGEDYFIQESFRKNSASNKNITEVKLNLNATFYLDVFGRIVGVGTTEVSNEAVYGFLFKIYTSTNDDEVIRLKVLDEAGDTVLLDLAEKVNLNGKKKQYPSKVKETLEAYNKNDDARNSTDNSDPLRQVIKYKLNEAGEISDIWNASKEEDAGLKCEGTWTSASHYNSYHWSSVAGTWGRQYYYDSTTTIFCIYPEETTCYTSSFHEDVRSYPDNTYSVYMYDKDASLTVGAAVRYFTGTVTATSDKMGQYHRMHVVTKVYEGLNAEDEPVTIVEAVNCTNGEKVEISTTEKSNTAVTTEFAKTKAGDIVQYKYDAANELTGYRILFYADRYGEFGGVNDNAAGNVHDAGQWIGLVDATWLYSTVKFVDGIKLVYKNYSTGEDNMIPLQKSTEKIYVARVNISNRKNITVETDLTTDVITPGSHFIIATNTNVGNGGIIIIEK